MSKRSAPEPNPKAFKHQVNLDQAERLATALRKAWPAFDKTSFLSVVAPALPPLELKERIAFIASTTASHLPENYEQALKVVLSTLGPPLEGTSHVASEAFYYWIHAHFVQTHGLKHFDLSLSAMCEITQRSTAEFAIRPFLLADTERVLKFLRKQLSHPNPHVRRWVSEGTRSRLPWGERLPMFQADPSEPLLLLEQLRNDPALYVRTSVANHLGDIAKDHPDTVVQTLKRWLQEHQAFPKKFPHAPWIAKRALRHLVKAGHTGALGVLGVSGSSRAVVSALTLDKKRVRVGDRLTLSAAVQAKVSEPLMIDYAVVYCLARGKTGRKVYKLKQLTLRAGETAPISKAHSFRPISTRVYYPGEHQLQLIVNGQVKAEASFQLVVPKSGTA